MQQIAEVLPISFVAGLTCMLTNSDVVEYDNVDYNYVTCTSGVLFQICVLYQGNSGYCVDV